MSEKTNSTLSQNGSPGGPEKKSRWFRRGRGERSEREARALALPPMSRRLQFFALALFFVLGVALTAFVLENPLGLRWLPRADADHGESTATVGTAEEPEQLYQCPMHPEVIESGPSDCPICGMKLVPMREVASSGPGEEPAGHAAETEGVVRVDPVQVQNMGVVTQTARVGEIARTVRTVGILDFNADRITWINTKFSGWIETVHVNYVGQEVHWANPCSKSTAPSSSPPKRSISAHWTTGHLWRGASAARLSVRRTACCGRRATGLPTGTSVQT